MKAHTSVGAIALLLCLSLLLPLHVAADRIFLPIIHKPEFHAEVVGRAVAVVGDREVGPAAGHKFGLAEIILRKPPIARLNSESPMCVSDADGRLAFQDVPQGEYVLAVWRPPDMWCLVRDPDSGWMSLIEVEPGRASGHGVVEMGMVRIESRVLYSTTKGVP